MRKFIIMMLATACMFVVSCKDNKKEEVVTIPDPPKQEVYQPKHQTTTVDFKTVKTYNYFKAPVTIAAKYVEIKYDEKQQYKKPLEIVYHYVNGDTYTYIINNFGVWKNEAGKLRIVADDDNTVWVQGQTKSGKFHEFIFYGDPKHNGSKIKPNSYRNLPEGEIKYR